MVKRKVPTDKASSIQNHATCYNGMRCEISGGILPPETLADCRGNNSARKLSREPHASCLNGGNPRTTLAPQRSGSKIYGSKIGKLKHI